MKTFAIPCFLMVLLASHSAFAKTTSIPPTHPLSQAADQAVFDYFDGQVHQTWGHAYEHDASSSKFTVSVMVDGKYQNSYRYGTHECFATFQQLNRQLQLNYIECEPVGD